MRYGTVLFVNKEEKKSMFGNQGTEYALNRPSKCLESCRNHRFLVGSCNVTGTSTSSGRGGNELVVLRHVEDVNELVVDAIFAVESPIDVLSVCNYDSNLLVTSSHYPSATSTTTSVYRIPHLPTNDHDEGDDDEEDSVYSNRPRLLTDASTRTTTDEELDHVMDLTTSSSSVVSSIIWNPDCTPEENDDDSNSSSTTGSNSYRNGSSSPSSNHHFATIQSDHVVHLYDLSRDDGCPIHTILSSSNKRSFCLPKASWNPHDTNIIAMTNHTTQRIHTCDLRSTNTTAVGGNTTSSSNRGVFACDVDYNPNKPYMLASGMSDGSLQFWDLRYTTHPIQKIVRGGHSHWANTIAYNPYHDQLLLSGGTDYKLNLWRISSLSSAPLLELEEEDDHDDDDDNWKDTKKSNNNNNNNKMEQDIRVGQYDMSDSISDVTWSTTDAWYFACVSYDGHVTLNHVPSKEKYKILL